MCSTLPKVISKILACNKCKTMNQGQRRVPGVGVIHPLVFFLGEAPGRLGANITGVPFTRDRSGRLLRDMMSKVGLSQDTNAYISNIVKCNPIDKRGRNRRPSREEVENCREYLVTEIELVQARVLVPLGGLAFEELLGLRRTMKDVNAKKYYHDLYGLIFPLYHPGYILRGNYSLDQYCKDFNRLKNLALNT